MAFRCLQPPFRGHSSLLAACGSKQSLTRLHSTPSRPYRDALGAPNGFPQRPLYDLRTLQITPDLTLITPDSLCIYLDPLYKLTGPFQGAQNPNRYSDFL